MNTVSTFELCFLVLYFCVQLSSQVFLDLVDSVIADVASECHRVARLGLDRDLEVVEEELRLSVEARAKVADPSNNLETNTKYVVDIFGQSHPPVATEVFNCMNCGRQIVAGRFAPHLERCMGKVRSIVSLLVPFELYCCKMCCFLWRLRNREERLAPRRPGAQLLPRTGTHDAAQVITTS